MRHLLIAAALVACSSAPREPSQAEVVIAAQKKTSSWPPKKPPEWFDAQIAEIRVHIEKGELRAALQQIDRSRAERPADETHAPVLRELRADLLRLILEMDTIRASLEPENDPIVFGEPLRFRIRLQNRSGKSVFIPAKPRGTSGSLFRIEVVKQEFHVEAAVVTTRVLLHIPLEKDVRLGPDETVEQVVQYDEAGNDRPLQGFRTYTVGGRLRPARLEVDGLPRWDAIPLRKVKIRSFPRNYEHLKTDPVRRIAQAIDKRAAAHLLVATALVPREQRKAACDILVDALQGNRRFDLALYSSLQYLTGVALGRDPNSWRAWWERVRKTFFEEAERLDPDVPSFPE